MLFSYLLSHLRHFGRCTLRSSSNVQQISPEEGLTVLRPKRRESESKDDDKSPNNINSIKIKHIAKKKK